MDITGTLRKLFELELKRNDKFMSDEDLHQILSEGDGVDCDYSVTGYSHQTICKTLGHALQQWILTSHCPVDDLPQFDLLNEVHLKQERCSTFNEAASLCDELQSLWSRLSGEEQIHHVRSIVVILGRRGLLNLLGLRTTVGSVERWPPPRKLIEETFNKSHKPPSLLSIGARALAKHCHRDETHSWWGRSTGSETAKNDHAAGVMRRILDNTCWLNIHQLPHDVVVIEARTIEGYGVRWTADGREFRGFLEPQMVNGHEVGWRH